jgi:hypothetical protein
VSHTVKRVAVVVLLVLATLLWTAGGVAVWAQRQVLDTKNWVETSDRMLENEQIRTALSDALLQRVYASAPVENRLREELPENLKGLAAPAAAGMRELASRNAPRVLGSAAFLTAWEKANTAAHKTFVRLIKGELASNGEVTLDLKSLLAQVAVGTGLPANVVDRLPPRLQQLQLIKSDQLKAAQDTLDTLRTLTIVVIVLAVLCLAGAVALSDDRRRGVIAAAGAIFFAGFIILAVRRLGSNVAVDSLAVATNARPAVRAVFLIGTSLLTDVAWGSILFALFLVTGAWLGGPGRRATWVRSKSAPALRDQPWLMRSGLLFLLLLLVIWGPVPWTRSLWPVLAFAAAAFGWLEWVRHRSLQEFGGPSSGGGAVPPAMGDEAGHPQGQGQPV